MSSYYNYENNKDIICPYCGKSYTPTFEDTIIGDECAECYTEDENTYTCDRCSKKFKMNGYIVWEYHTETIDGQMTEEEWEKLYGG